MYLNAERTQTLCSFEVMGFCAWTDASSILRTPLEYGLELKTRDSDDARSSSSHHFIAAYNRLDLEGWTRAFMASMDPTSAAATDLAKQRRKVRRAKRKAEAKAQKETQMWTERQARLREREVLKAVERQEAIRSMTPLERSDGLGSLDASTARLLEKRRQRKQKKTRNPNTGRIGREAYRRRLDETVGGKVTHVNAWPRALTKTAQPQRAKVELPPPGQFVEALVEDHDRAKSRPQVKLKGLTSKGRKNSQRVVRDTPKEDLGLSDSPSRSSSSASSSSDSESESELESSEEDPEPVSFQRTRLHPPPPPPPPSLSTHSSVSSMASTFSIPPPPPAASFSSEEEEKIDNINRKVSQVSLNNTARRVSVASNKSVNPFAASLANILKQSTPKGKNVKAGSASIESAQPPAPRISQKSYPNPLSTHSSVSSMASSFSIPPPPPVASSSSEEEEVDNVNRKVSQVSLNNTARRVSVASNKSVNPFAASLANILKQSTPKGKNVKAGSASIESAQPPAPRISQKSYPKPTKPNVPKARQSQLSKEGKEMFQSAIISGYKRTVAVPVGRKGLFDDSSSSGDEELFSSIARTKANTLVSNSLSPDGASSENGPESIRISKTKNLIEKKPKAVSVPSPSDDPDSSDSSSSSEADDFLSSKTKARDHVAAFPGDGEFFDHGKDSASVAPTFVACEVIPISHQVINHPSSSKKKSFAQYTFEFRIGPHSCTSRISLSYHEMHDIHSRLEQEGIPYLPKFPSKHIFRNSLKPENMHKRELELQHYFKQLLLLPDVRSNERFHFEYKLSLGFIQQLRILDSNAAARPAFLPTSHGTTEDKSTRAVLPKTSLFDDIQNSSESSDEEQVKEQRPPPALPMVESVPQVFSQPKKESFKGGSSKIMVSTSPIQRQPPASGVELDIELGNIRSKTGSKTGPTKQTPSSSSSSTQPASTQKTITGLPERPNLFGGGRGALMTAIRQQKDSATTKSSGALLPETSPLVVKAQAQAQALPSMNIGDAISSAMASRRVQIEAHSSSDEDEDWE